MLIRRIASELSNEQLQEAFKELRDWMNSGVLKQDGIIASIHSKYEEQAGMDESLQVTEKAVLFEIGERFLVLSNK